MSERHAFMIIAHKNVAQVQRLVRALDYPDNDIILHIDPRFIEGKACDFAAAASRARVDAFSAVQPGWGAYSLVNTELECLNRALSAGPHRYYHLLSGQDYPLAPPDELHSFFANETREFVHFCNPDEWEEQLIRRVSVVRHPELRHFKELECKWAALKRRMPTTRLRADTRYGYGSNWFSITQDLASRLMENRSWIDERFSHAVCADEHFVQSYILTFGLEDRLFVPIGHKTMRSNMRAIDFERGGGTHPYVWRSSDYEWLANSGLLFARKFDASLDSGILDKIDSGLLRLR